MRRGFALPRCLQLITRQTSQYAKRKRTLKHFQSLLSPALGIPSVELLDGKRGAVLLHGIVSRIVEKPYESMSIQAKNEQREKLLRHLLHHLETESEDGLDMVALPIL